MSVIKGEAKSTHDKRSALHLFRLGEAMLHIIRNKSRPLLHMMRAWSVVAPHLVEVLLSIIMIIILGRNYIIPPSKAQHDPACLCVP